MVELLGMAGGDDEGHGEHSDARHGPAQIKEQQAVVVDGAVRVVQQGEVAGDEEQADLRRAEEAVREVEAGEGVGSQVAFCGEQLEGDQHGDSNRPVDKAGAAEARHHGQGAQQVDHVVDVEAVAGALLVAQAGEGAVKAVAEPVENKAEDSGEEREAMAYVTPAASWAARPSAVSWSEVTQAGMRWASQWRARRSAVAVRAWWIRGAGAKAVVVVVMRISG